MNKALEDGGFSARKSIKGFAERGYIESFDGKTQKRLRFGDNLQTWCYCLKIDNDWTDADDLLPFD